MHRNAFSLVELSIALVVAGLLASVALSMSNVSNRAECYATTKTQLATINDALLKFAQKNDRYPVPADRRLGVDNPDYGREATPAQIAAHALDTVGTSPKLVYYGALPFQALGLPTSFAADCWDNKFTYAVTVAYTSMGTPAGTGDLRDPAVNGAITINNTATNLLLDGAAFAVISHGQDALGAVTRNYHGSDKKWCNSQQNSFSLLKNMNCNLQSTTIAAAAYNDGKDGQGAYYDDIVIFYGRPMMPLPCAANTALQWMQGAFGPCSATSPAMEIPHNGVITVIATNPGFSGSVKATCKNGAFIPSNPVCTPPVWHVASSGADTGPETCTAMIGVDVATIADGMACNYYNPTTQTCRNHANELFKVNCGGPPLTACAPFSGSASAGGYCSIHGCQTNYKVTIRNSLYAQSGNSTTVLNNQDVEDVGTALYNHCPLASGWHLHPYTVTIGQATGTCETDAEPGVVTGGYGPTSAPNRATSWDVSVVNIPTCDPTPTPPADCSGTLSWGTYCSVNIGSMASGTTSSVANTASGYTGGATISCTNGATTISNPVCTVASPVPINGKCGPGPAPYSTSRGSCSAGTTVNGMQFMGPVCSPTCPNYATWDCAGSGGGSTAHCATKATMGCFLQDVVIAMADGSSKPVSALEPGDKVQGQTRVNTVVRIPNFTSDQRVYGLNGGKEFVTGGHPLRTTTGWKAIDPTLTPLEKHNVKTTKLKLGDAIYQRDGTTLRVRSIDSEDSGDHLVFNPILDGDHTYYANGLLAHNKCNDACETPDSF